MTVTKKVKPTLSPEEKAAQYQQAEIYTNGLVEKAVVAEKKYASFSQNQVDQIVGAMAQAASQAALELAKAAIAETQRGILEDKVIKNQFAAENVYNTIKHDRTVGIINNDQVAGKIEIAAPLGVLAGIVPTTNPTSTAIFKSLLALKTRNAIIFAFHPQAQKCSVQAAKIVYQAALKAGAPQNIIQWIAKPSLDNTTALIRNPKIASILATGGPGMVNAALKSGNPSMGVGAGNGAVYVDHTVDLDRAVEDLLLSKRFDNGMICATENSVVVEAAVYDAWLEKVLAKGAYLLPPKDYQKLADFVFNDRHGVNGPVAGKSAKWIAEQAGIDLPADKDVIIFELDPKNIGEKLSSEKLSPLLSVYKAQDRQAAIKIVAALLNYQGAGHNAAIQIGSQDDPFINEFADQTQAARILINQPDSIGAIGDIYTAALRPSLTLGTGSWGKNSLSHNLSTRDLLNIKTVAKRRSRPQWIRLPKEIFYEKHALSYLQDVHENINRALIITDADLSNQGLIEEVNAQLALRDRPVKISIFDKVTADTNISQTLALAQVIAQFNPDTIIALGGGTVINAAKLARFTYEYSLDQKAGFLEDYQANRNLFMSIEQKLMDISERVVKFNHHLTSQLIAIPTTSGSGSEVTPFAIVTDNQTKIKYPLADYALTPETAIIDPELTKHLPKAVVATGGMDTLSHALEAYVSVMSSDFTRPWSLEAIKLVFQNLVAAYNYDPAHPTFEGEAARKKMHYAATLAGMAFANSFLGLTHSLAHKTSGEFGLPSGLAVACAMIPVIRFNAVTGKVKRTPFPRYAVYRAQKDYAEIASFIGLKGQNDAELVEQLCQQIEKLMTAVKITPRLSANHVTKQRFEGALKTLVEMVYTDRCTTTNPRQASLAEIEQLLRDQF
nr:bifunctional acetaldehyde-CoA/alcohol dehydrogenase [Liquorilactobacillus sicerae]